MTLSSPSSTSDAVARYFAKRAPFYAQNAGRGLWAWQKNREAKALFSLAGPLAGKSLLDLGCGAGFYAKLALGVGATDITAVDRCPEMLATIKEPAIQAIAADAARLDLDRTFDLVLLAGVLEFADDPGALIESAARHCKASGRILVLFPPAGPAGRFYRAFHDCHGFHVTLFSRTGLVALATAAGLRETGRSDAWPLALVARLER